MSDCVLAAFGYLLAAFGSLLAAITLYFSCHFTTFWLPIDWRFAAFRCLEIVFSCPLTAFWRLLFGCLWHALPLCLSWWHVYETHRCWLRAEWRPPGSGWRSALSAGGAGRNGRGEAGRVPYGYGSAEANCRPVVRPAKFFLQVCTEWPDLLVFVSRKHCSYEELVGRSFIYHSCLSSKEVWLS